ncbi:MAG TPA: hypothetical protein VMS00_00525 [Acidimicrobiales bacterium]|nr:hypothetical protein [Acidimicrobiales bacterium]
MQEPIPSAKRPSGWRRAKFVAGTLALTMGALGAGLAATAAPAWANANTNSYLIGSVTGAVSSVTLSPTATTAASSTSLEVFFKATSALVAGNNITVASSVALGSVPASIQVIDSPTCLQAGADGGTVTTTSVGITLQAGCSIAVGDTVQVDFTFAAPGSSPTFTVTTTNNGSASSGATLTVNPTPPTLSASSYTTGFNAAYTISQVGVTGANGGSWATFTGAANDIELTATATPGFALYNGIAGYSVSYIPSGGSATADALTAFTVGSVTPGTVQSVWLTLTTAIPAGATVTVNAEGTNGSTADQTTTFSVIPESAALLIDAVGPAETTNHITFGSSMTALKVTPSTGLAGASSNYLISFTAGSVATADVCFSEPSDGTVFSSITGVLVTDTTGGWQLVPPIGNVHENVAGCGQATNPSIVIPITGETIKAGDLVTVLLAGVTNPAAQTVSDLTGTTDGDQLPDTAAAYAITISAAGGISVTVSPASTGSLSTYTISNIVVSSAGVAAGTTITIGTNPPTGGTTDTTLPNNPSDYVFTDTTTKAGSGVATLVTGAPSQTVVITVPNALTAGDIISITINDVINPTGAGSYSISLTGNLQGPTVVAPSFPQANVTYPDGAIVNFSGTDYLFAGGHAFGIPTVAVLVSLQTVDHAVTINAPTGALVPSAAPLLGTTIVVYNNPTIYVVGASGLNGFSTPTQFLGDGYDPADVITVPSFGGLSVGATVGSVGTADNAVGTVANGAIIDSSGTFYVIAGAHAFGIPTLAVLATVQAGDPSTPLVGTVPAGWTTSVIANGTLITVNSAVFVSEGGDLFAFKAFAQLVADGFGGTPSIVTPNYGGIPIVTSYLGS